MMLRIQRPSPAHACSHEIVLYEREIAGNWKIMAVSKKLLERV